MSSHKNKLELYVSEKFREIYKYARPTIGSGSTPAEKGDVKNPWFACECKMRNTKSFSIKNDVWEKICYEADRESKDALYIVENSSGNKLAIMNADEWFCMLYELIELRTAIKEYGGQK